LSEGETEGDPLTDAALLRAHVAGDPDAFGTLITRHQDRLWTIAIRISVVAAALGTLNADQRAALVLVDMEGYSVEEAARILGCAPGTVKSRCARGRARLLPLVSHLKAEEGS
jgi:RNA polymerase sigma-70 factor, ECF subfamily